MDFNNIDLAQEIKFLNELQNINQENYIYLAQKGLLTSSFIDNLEANYKEAGYRSETFFTKLRLIAELKSSYVMPEIEACKNLLNNF